MPLTLPKRATRYSTGTPNPPWIASRDHNLTHTHHRFITHTSLVHDLRYDYVGLSITLGFCLVFKSLVVVREAGGGRLKDAPGRGRACRFTSRRGRGRRVKLMEVSRGGDQAAIQCGIKPEAARGNPAAEFSLQRALGGTSFREHIANPVCARGWFSLR